VAEGHTLDQGKSEAYLAGAASMLSSKLQILQSRAYNLVKVGAGVLVCVQVDVATTDMPRPLRARDLKSRDRGPLSSQHTGSERVLFVVLSRPHYLFSSSHYPP